MHHLTPTTLCPEQVHKETDPFHIHIRPIPHLGRTTQGSGDHLEFDSIETRHESDVVHGLIGIRVIGDGWEWIQTLAVGGDEHLALSVGDGRGHGWDDAQIGVC